MNILLPCLVAALMQSQALAGEQVELIGHYTNMVYSRDADPHFLSGYNLDLSIKNDVALARLGVAVGTEEPVGSTIQEVVFDPRTKRLRFRAEYSEGQEFSEKTGPEGRPARAIVTFSGSVKPGKIVGTITTRDGYCSDCKAKIEKVTLKRMKDTTVYPVD